MRKKYILRIEYKGIYVDPTLCGYPIDSQSSDANGIKFMNVCRRKNPFYMNINVI